MADYAEECFVHAGAPGALSPEERDESLRAFTASIERRISRLQAFAAEWGTALPVPHGDRSKVEAIAQQLDELCKSRLSGLTEIELALAMDWRARQPRGLEGRVHTLAIDLGAYCGEIGIRCAPQYQWVIDVRQYTPSTIMATSGRVVIGHEPAVMVRPMENPVDAMGIAAFALTQVVHCRKVKAKRLWRPNYFYFLSELADGHFS